MGRFIVRRLLQGLVLMFLVAAVVFVLGRLTGNPADLMLPEDATPEDRARLIQQLGLDGPMHRQFITFIGNAVQAGAPDGFSVLQRVPSHVGQP